MRGDWEVEAMEEEGGRSRRKERRRRREGGEGRGGEGSGGAGGAFRRTGDRVIIVVVKIDVILNSFPAFSASSVELSSKRFVCIIIRKRLGYLIRAAPRFSVVSPLLI